MTPPRLFLHPLITLVICAFIASACGDDPAPAPKKPPAASGGGGGGSARGGKGKKKKKTIEELKADIQRKSPLTASIFSPITEKVRTPLKENRNPFSGFVDIRLSELQRQRELENLAKAKSTDTAIQLLPLQRFDLRQIKLVATVTDTPILQAEIIDPNGERHTIIIGTDIGPVGNRVEDIRQGEVKIMRLSKDDNPDAAPTCTLLRISPSLDSLIQATREANGDLDELEITDDGGVKCTVISFYPKKLDSIKISYQD